LRLVRTVRRSKAGKKGLGRRSATAGMVCMMILPPRRLLRAVRLVRDILQSGAAVAQLCDAIHAARCRRRLPLRRPAIQRFKLCPRIRTQLAVLVAVEPSLRRIAGSRTLVVHAARNWRRLPLRRPAIQRFKLCPRVRTQLAVLVAVEPRGGSAVGTFKHISLADRHPPSPARSAASPRAALSRCTTGRTSRAAPLTYTRV
jgi:hypothetical protein